MTRKKNLTTPIFIVLGVGCLIAAAGVFLLQEETLMWTEGTAVIKGGEIATRPGRSEGTNKTMYEPRVSYEYTVAGKNYTGNRIGVVSKVYNTESTAQAVLSKYEVGLQVPVFYDPADPGNAVLEKGGSLIFPLAVGLGGLVMLGFGFMEHRSRKNAERYVAEVPDHIRYREEKARRVAEVEREQAARQPVPDRLISDQEEARALARKIIAHLVGARENPEILEVARGGFNAQVVRELHWVYQDVCEEEGLALGS